MKINGIRILDKIDKIVSVELSDILHEISDGDYFYWSILYLYATGNLGEGHSIPSFEKKINESKKGVLFSWEELNSLSRKFWDLMDITIIACKDKNIIKRYNNNQEMYEKCDIVIEMIDSSYWEVFSKNSTLISTLNEKFKDTEILNLGFEN